jgi:hypothetical protein
MDLQELGITKEELVDRLVAKLSDDLMEETFVAYDPDGGPEDGVRPTKLANAVHEAIENKIDERINDLAEHEVAPRVGDLIKNFVVKTTNRYGEPKAPDKTLTEYIVERCNGWLEEKVDGDGHSREEDRYGNWRASQTRIGWMIHKHLDFHIKHALTDAVGNLNKSIAAGLETTIKLQLKEVLGKLKVDVKT